MSKPGKRLESWKEIAAYLRRDVKTARRWEQREGLPVHRHLHGALGSVYAFEDEIESWRAQRRAPRPTETSSRAGQSVPALVGRDRELARLDAALEMARGGTRQTVFISGELGIGKSALVQTFLARLDASVWAAEGQCVEQFGSGEPYLPVVEALTRLASDARDTAVADAIDRCAPSWANTILQRRRPREGFTSYQGDSQDRSAGELCSAIEALAATRPVVLLFEDLHWSDHATVELLARLARRRESIALMIIGTYRPAGLAASESALWRLLQELRAHFHSDEVSVPFLSEDAVRSYLQTQGSWQDLAAAARWFHGHTEGNALFLVHSLQHLIEQGHVTRHEDTWSFETTSTDPRLLVPRTLRGLIETQLGALNDDSRRVLDIASVAGDAFAAASVADAADMDLHDTEWLLQDLAYRGEFIRESVPQLWPDGALSSAYRFVHQSCRMVIYERIAAGTRASLHRRIGSRLDRAYGARAGEIAAELAMHFERGRNLPMAIVKYRQAAEHAIARGAHHEAHLCATSALTLLGELPPGIERDAQERDLRSSAEASLQLARDWQTRG